MGTMDGIVWELNNRTSEWKWDAACQGMGPEIFYPEPSQDRENKERIRQARETCARCMVKSECLTFAMDNLIPFGIWGGLTPLERKALRHERKAV